MDEDPRQLSELIRQIYAAAMQPDLWPQVLEQLSDRFNAQSALLRLMDSGCSHIGFLATHNYDDRYIEAYRAHFIHQDPMNAYLLTQPASMAWFSTPDLLPGFRQSEYYNDYAKPQGIDYVAGSMVIRDGSRTATIGIQRGGAQGPFVDAEQEAFKLLLPHVLQAMHVHYRIGEYEQLRLSTEQALERLPFGIVVLDEAQRVVYFNARAKVVIDTTATLTLQKEQLVAYAPADQAALKHLITNAIAGEGVSTVGGGALRFKRDENDDVVLLSAPMTAVAGPFANQWPQGKVLLFVGSPRQTRHLDEGILRGLYDITRSESRVAQDLVDGFELEQIAQRRGVSLHTVRSQLKQLFRKTDTRRQPELVALLLTLPLAMREGSG